MELQFLFNPMRCEITNHYGLLNMIVILVLAASTPVSILEVATFPDL